MAITTDSDMVICIAPELEGQETRIDCFIDIAKLSVSESVWGDKANYATALLTAHMLTMSNRKGVGGEVKRKKLGDAEIEYGINTADNPDSLYATSYGKEYLRCRGQLVLSPLISDCCT